MRRWSGLIAPLFLVVSPAVDAAADESSGRLPTQQRPITRTDVLAGDTSHAQALDLLKASVEAAGGESVQAPERDPVQDRGSEEPLGGWAAPIIAADLDGQAGDETLVLQSVGEYPGEHYVTALGQGRILWRDSLPKRIDVAGVIPANLDQGAGAELVLLGLSWSYDQPARSAHIQGYGAEGLLWAYEQKVSWFEPNGVVEADGDAADEIAITLWEGPGPVGIRVLDGDGQVLRTVRSSVEEATSRTMWSETFVTDGPGSAPDEAVFIMPLLAGYIGERRSLSDGEQTAMDVKINAEFPTLYQGPDYTGDGRRDALIRDYAGWPLATSVNLGVFDAAALSASWTTATRYGEPFPVGDADGDGGDDLCYEENSYWFFGEPDGPHVVARCLAGRTGAELWKRSVEPAGEESFADALTWSDLQGDGVTDAVIVATSYTCDEDWWCEPNTFEAIAVDGRNGTELWSTARLEDEYLVWGLVDANLDGEPGDEMLEFVHDETAPAGARFSVHNGLRRQRSWDGTIDTGELPAYVGSAIDADIDGDGSSEAIVGATAYEETGVICEEWENEIYCYTEYAYYPFITAFSANGTQLWQVQL